MQIDILGIPFHALTPGEAVDRAVALLDKKGVRRVVTPNPEIVWKCRKDPALREAVLAADLILADGVGITRAARMLGRPLPGRVMGVEWAEAMLPELARLDKRLYLLGGKPGVAALAKERLCARYPGLTVCGVHDGYFQNDRSVCEAITQARADLVYVCLGTPRQELWMHVHGAALGDVMLAGLGGSIDVFSGTVKRAPRLWSKLGLEWLYRVLRQPSRLPRLAALPHFLLAVRRQKRREK